MADKKSKKRRSKIKNASLVKKYNSKLRQEYLDYDYLEQLSEEELEFLNDFTSEWLNASVPSQKNARKARFHKTKKLVKDCTDRNNARNRCMYGLAKAGHALDSTGTSHQLSDYIDDVSNIHKTEDVLNEIIDLKREHLGETKNNSNNEGNDTD